MVKANQFVSAMIDSGARALAAGAAEHLLDTHPELRARFAPDPFAGWREHLAHRLAQLSASIAMDTPALFASDIAWSKAAFSVRGVPIDDLRRSLAALRETLTQELPEGAHAIVERHLDAGAQTLRTDEADIEAALATQTASERLTARYILAVLEGDRLRASRVVLDAVDEGLPALDAYLHVLVPAEREIGRMWHIGELNVVEEHFATATTELVASLLYPRLQRAAPNGKVVIAAAAPGNLHALAVRLVADVFETRGWRAIHLGADVPIIDLAQGVEFFAADALAVSVTMTTQLKAAAALIATVRTTDAGKRVKIIVGGQAFRASPDLWRTIGADAGASDPLEAAATAAALVGL